MSWWDVFRVAVGFLALGIITYAWAVEPVLIKITRREIEIPALPSALAGVKICHLSDLHVAGYGRIERALRKVLMQIEADICVITGDIVATRGGIPVLAKVLEGFSPKHGIFGVLGNGEHDPTMPGVETAKDLRKLGIQVLVNESASISINGSEVQIVGVDDPFLGLDDVKEAFAGLGKGSLRILLAHSPDVLKSLGEHSVDIIFAGHTHGGQIRVPFFGVVWTHCRYNLRIASGYFGPEAISLKVGRNLQTRIYVSRGISGSGIRARFLCRPEVAILTLKPEASTLAS
ncbi:MAG: metallophosphoesterase [Armatimonadetes bacterium]|nr:metallophosphoesterase [Armatimonadota bacterium]